MVRISKSTRRKLRVREKLRYIAKRLRLVVFRSGRYIYGQIIDDKKGATLVSVSENQLSGEKKMTKSQKAKLLGEIMAEEALKTKIKEVTFDRGKYQYHGRIKAFAEGARTGGLKF